MSNWIERVKVFMSKLETASDEKEVFSVPETGLDVELAEEDDLDEVLIALEDVRDLMDTHTVALSSLQAAVKEISASIRVLVEVLRSNGSGLSGATNVDAQDMSIVIDAQRKIIRAFLNTPELNIEAKTAVATRLANMPDWIALESAEKRLAERAKSKQAVDKMVAREERDDE